MIHLFQAAVFFGICMLALPVVLVLALGAALVFERFKVTR